MAKRKDSVALFEVIKAQKKREEKAAAAASASTHVQRPAALRTPKWWFKRAPKPQQALPPSDPFVAPALPAPQATVTDAMDPGMYSPDEDPTITRASSLVTRVVPAAPAPERVNISSDRTHDPFGLEAPSETANVPARSRLKLSWPSLGAVKRQFGLNPDKGEVTFKLRYPTVIIAGFAVIVAFSLAYLIGRQGNGQASAGANGVTSAQVKRGPILAGVLDIQPERSAISDEEENTTSQQQNPAGPNAGDATPPATGGDAPKPTAPTEKKPDNGHRTLAGGVEAGLPRANGLNYVIIQSYPEKELAEKAQEALHNAGIPCTVERPPSGWTSNKVWCVIGTYGFPRTTSMPEYNRYIRDIENVGKVFAGKSKYKSFNPSPKKWSDS